ncbi:hypothetical protein [Nocardia africana]
MTIDFREPHMVAAVSAVMVIVLVVIAISNGWWWALALCTGPVVSFYVSARLAWDRFTEES